MNILVTGGCGFIGTRLCEVLVEQGHIVVNLDRLTYAANVERAHELQETGRYTLIEGDCCNWSLVFGLLHEYCIDAVMHLAAESHVDRSISGPQTFMEANVMGTYGVLEGVRGYLPNAPPDFRMLHVSTDEVFGDLPIHSPTMFDEESRYRPSSPYSASKAAGDWLVKSWGRTFGVPWVITHGANAYGPRQLPDKLIPMAITNGIKGEPITIHGDGRNVRSWLHVDDHVSGLIAVLNGGELMNAYCLEAHTERNNIAVCELIRDLLYESGYEAELRFVPDRPGNDLRYSMDGSKVRRHTSWSPKVVFHEGLYETIDWYIKHG